MLKCLFFGALIACSLAASLPESRVIGGDETSVNSVPWAAGIIYFGALRCSASVFHPYAVLTSATCVQDLLIDEVRVVIGSSSLIGALSYQVTDIYAHYNYRPVSFNYDLAVAFLQTELVETESVHFVPLAYAWSVLEPGSPGTIAGWAGADSNTLALGELLVIDHEECLAAYADIKEVTNDMFCAGVEDGSVDICEQNEGAGLVVNGTLIGVYSFGNGCRVAEYPSVFTNVAFLRNWINEIMV